MINVQTVAVIGSGTMGAALLKLPPVMDIRFYCMTFLRSADPRNRRDTRAAKFTRDAGKLTAETCERTLKRLIPVTEFTRWQQRIWLLKRRLNVWK